VNSLEITCSHLSDLVTEYMESALDPKQQLSFETHVVFCSDCLVFLGQIRDTVALLRGLPPEPVAEKERAAVLAAYDGR
jgi:hypothetical protein